jgi:hypothetical protein
MNTTANNMSANLLTSDDSEHHHDGCCLSIGTSNLISDSCGVSPKPRYDNLILSENDWNEMNALSYDQPITTTPTSIPQQEVINNGKKVIVISNCTGFTINM